MSLTITTRTRERLAEPLRAFIFNTGEGGSVTIAEDPEGACVWLTVVESAVSGRGNETRVSLTKDQFEGLTSLMGYTGHTVRFLSANLIVAAADEAAA